MYRPIGRRGLGLMIRLSMHSMPFFSYFTIIYCRRGPLLHPHGARAHV